jgi:hypothetical protein
VVQLAPRLKTYKLTVVVAKATTLHNIEIIGRAEFWLPILDATDIWTIGRRMWITEPVRIECGASSYNLEIQVDAAGTVATESQIREVEWTGGPSVHENWEVEGPTVQVRVCVRVSRRVASGSRCCSRSLQIAPMREGRKSEEMPPFWEIGSTTDGGKLLGE